MQKTPPPHAAHTPDPNSHAIGYSAIAQTDDGRIGVGALHTTLRAARDAAGAQCRATRRTVTLWALYATEPRALLVATARWAVGAQRVEWEAGEVTP